MSQAPPDPVVLALRTAIAAGDSIDLRLALGEHLLRHGMAAEALVEFEAALALSPAHREALDGAARAAEVSGDAARAHAYRLALGNLRASAVAPPVQPTAAAPPRLRLVSPNEPPADALSVVRFADVGGMSEIKAQLDRSFLAAQRNPALFRRFGKQIGGGLVLYGPPGCGKTFLARALAGEIGARFVNVGLAEVLDMWFGESEKHLHEIFENARRQAPTLMFFDEVDALGQRRSNLKGAAGRTLVNQLLSELDGFTAANEGVFFLAATNHPWDLDPALRRPGRFDRLVFVPPPDAPARQQILALKIAARPAAPHLDLTAAARATDGFSGADLQAVVERAIEFAIEASLARGSEQPLDDEVLRRAIRDTRASTRPWFEVARNYAVYANEGGVYDELLAHLKGIGLA
ncbi:MAG TPA: ATP-binding protein [Candidatus Polarisedimenticolia bacterium]|jgi:SpoVK/Ycf46/Vps4 family AAA+-type ATPase|nr:ATP-binding protein [Candidatus Polarisedimenticolia bacterium]